MIISYSAENTLLAFCTYIYEQKYMEKDDKEIIVCSSISRINPNGVIFSDKLSMVTTELRIIKLN